MTQGLPSSPEMIINLEWADYEPHYSALESPVLSQANIEQWLMDWGQVSSYLDEQYTRLYVATTQNTENKEIEQRFQHFLDVVQPAARAADQKLKQKLLESGLQPAGFHVALQRLRAESDIFSEPNLALLGEEQKLGTEYNKIIGAQTVLWEGQEGPSAWTTILLRRS